MDSRRVSVLHVFMFCSFVLSACASAHGDVGFSIDEVSIITARDVTFSTDIRISSWDNAVGAFSLLLRYDPAVVRILDVSVLSSAFEGNTFSDSHSYASGETRVLGFQTVQQSLAPTSEAVLRVLWDTVGGVGSSCQLAADVETLIDTSWRPVEVLSWPAEVTVELDSDGDGVPDTLDHFPHDATESSDDDEDGLGDNLEQSIVDTAQGDGDPSNDWISSIWEVRPDDDFDNDGLTNLGESQNATDPANPDTDDDGLSDGDEVGSYGTDPLSMDTDNDGYTDSDEVDNGVSPVDSGEVPEDNDGDYLSDLNDPDDDNDGLDDVVETGTGVFVDETDTGTDPLEPDSDGDGLSDGDEVNAHNTDPCETDTDGDSLGDGTEINLLGTDPLRTDTDYDGYTDSDEVDNGVNPADSGEIPEDNDGDYLSDLNDPDDDNDGLDDVVETGTGVFVDETDTGTNPLSPDTDNDGMPDGWEIAYGFDPLQGTECYLDYPDGDGLTNCQEYEYGTDPLESDTDGDGLTDGEEVTAWETDPTLRDTDGDTFWDSVEVYWETDPLGEESHPEPSGITGDVTCDSTVDAIDVQLVINWSLGLDIPYPIDFTDLNDDGLVNALDVQLVINAALGIAI